MCPWADVLFGFDAKWWKHYQKEVESFPGEKLSASMVATNYGAKVVVLGYRNSGACAVSLAMSRGATKVILLGYDAMFWNGKRHWHDDHPEGLENAGMIADWGGQFEMIAKAARRRGVEVLNASRRTRLQCFPLVDLEEALREEQIA